MTLKNSRIRPKEVGRITSEMEKVKIQVGLKNAEGVFDYVRNKPELKPFTGEVIAIFERIHSL
jgi:hypothetical protein